MNQIEPLQWAERYYLYLHKVAASRVNDAEQALDLVQDTFLAGLEQLDHFKGISTEKTWLTGILLHKIMDHYRHQSVKQAKETEIIAEQIRERTNYSNDEVLSHKELLKMVKQKLMKMPRLWADVFQLKYLEDAPTEVICKQLEITAANFWTISHRSRLQIRNCLKNAG